MAAEITVAVHPDHGPYATGLARNGANHAPLTPLSFLERAADIYPERLAVVHGASRYTYRELRARSRRLASALVRAGVEPGDTVAVMAPNTPAVLEAHHGVPMAGAVLNALNVRLDAATIAFILDHGEAKVLLTDTEFAPVIREALRLLGRPILVVDIADSAVPDGQRLGGIEYEDFLAEGDPDFAWSAPRDEWDAIALGYTSGTTGNPKGVVLHHRGAFLNAMGNAFLFGLNPHSVYLWTLPMFHCNGWTYTWGVTAAGGTHVCLRKVDPALVFAMIEEHGVTHICGAPIVLTMLIHAPAAVKRRPAATVQVVTGGAAPPSAVIEAMEAMNFRITHMYGLTEVYGPATLCVPQDSWDALPVEGRAARIARQGVRFPTMDGVAVADSGTLEPVPPDSVTIGEIMLRGNTVMKGYLKNPTATAEAFAGGWYHTGDLGVLHADGYIEVKDRAKDIIISGGENVSSLEVEEVLYRHPAVMEAAVVARPDEKWGETPCAFIALKADAGEIEAAAIVEWCRAHMAGFKVPRRVVFGPLPKTSTGKIQKYELRERAKAIS